jgi:hypothetical protein
MFFSSIKFYLCSWWTDIISLRSLYCSWFETSTSVLPSLSPDTVSNYAQSLSNIEIFAIVWIIIGGVLLILGFIGNERRSYIEWNFPYLSCCATMWGFKSLNAFYAISISGLIISEIVLFTIYINIVFKQNLLVIFKIPLLIIMLEYRC